MDLFVGSLSSSIDNASLRKLFEIYGKVASAKVIFDRDTGVSRGFGFVTMPDEDEARNSIKKLHRQHVEGSFIKVTEARPKK